MNVELTIQKMFDDYPDLFITRQNCLDHLFCVIGNGYEWNKKGELEHSGFCCDKKHETVDESALEKRLVNGKAFQYRVLDTKKDLYLYYAETSDTKREKERWMNRGANADTTPGSGVNKNHWYFHNQNDLESYKDCSYIFNYPKNIAPDWLDAINECKELLRKDGMDADMLKKKDKPIHPVITATDIRWDVDMYEALDKLDDMSSDKAAEYLGVPKEIYANMTTFERHDYAYDVWRHNKKGLSEFVGVPNEVTLPTTGIWDEDSISDYLSDEYGWCHEGFRITCNYSIEEMEARVKDIHDGLMTDNLQAEIKELNIAIALMKSEEKGWVIPEFFKEDDDDLLR